MTSPEKKSSGQSEDQQSSQEDSPASLTALQANVKHLVTSVTSGRNSGESFAKLDRDGSWVKTSRGSAQASLDGSMEAFCETWPRWGTVLDGEAGRLPMLERHTTGKGSSLLLTPSAMNVDPTEGRLEKRVAYRASVGRQFTPGGLAEQIAMLPTPSTQEIEHPEIQLSKNCRRLMKTGDSEGHSVGLADRIALLPTPRANEVGRYQRDHGKKDGKERPTLTGAIALIPTLTSRDSKGMSQRGVHKPGDSICNTLGVNGGLKLQPAFAEWMMGFPLNYTLAESTATLTVSPQEGIAGEG